MKKLAKWVVILFAGILALLVLASAAINVLSEMRLRKTYEVEPQPVAIPSDGESISYGGHVALIRGCTECHGPDLGGDIVLEEAGFGRIVASNLTAGRGGVGDAYTEQDWLRAIAHGVDPQGRALLAMPSAEYHQLSDEDLGALLGYVTSIEPVDRQLPANQIGLPLRAFVVAGLIPGPDAERIDHNAPRPEAPEPGITTQYGQYLAITCTGCHGAGLSGGPIPGAPPDALPAPNLTPGGNLTGWTEADFVRTMRTGVTPSGHNLDAEQMPWPMLGQMTDDELKAVWLYLQSLPATAYGNH